MTPTNTQTRQKRTYTCPETGKEFSTMQEFRQHKKTLNTDKTPSRDHKTDKPEKESDSNVKKLPVNRDYQFKGLIPDVEAEYVESDKEKTKIMADIENRDNTGQKPRYLISGPTGSGKTHLVKTVASELNAPLFTIQGKYSLDESDLLGSPVLVNGETIWTDGTLTKALIASRDVPVVLLVDELNRARPESKGVLFSALDDRCSVTLDGRNGEEIRGDPENLIVVGTINEGRDYTVQDLDKAEKRRFGRKFEVDYLGLNDINAERDLLTERTPAFKDLSKRFMIAVNDVRRASKDAESFIQSGIPTSSVIETMNTAYAYSAADIDNPLIEAAQDTVVKPVYDDEKVRSEVMETFKDYLDDCPVEEQQFREYQKNPDGYDPDVVKCEYCGTECKSERGVKQHQTLSGCKEENMSDAA